VVVDECHHTSAEVFSRALHKLNFRYSLGLSATVQRKDGLAYVFQWFLGPIVYRAKRRAERVDVRALEFASPDTGYRQELYIYGKQLNMARMISNMCAHPPRTAFIVDAIMGCFAQGRKVLVLSERRTHLMEIHRETVARGAARVGGEERAPTLGYYVGGLKQQQLKQSELEDVVLGTFAMAAEGMDIPALNTLVLASPKTDIEQSVGRILRVSEAARTTVPLVVDIVDPFSVFAAQARKRGAYYRKSGFRTL
jgi:superfamily II DNA or RNA helicase